MMKRKYAAMRRRPYNSYRRAALRPMRSRYVPRPVCSNVVITRRVEFPPFVLTPTANVWNNTNYSFRMVDVPSFGELTSLFDQYRITSVKLTWIPTYKNLHTQLAPFPSIASPVLYVAPSEDGTSNLTTKLTAFQDSALKMIADPYKNFTVTLKPSVQFEVATTLTIAGASPKSNVWLDCDNPSVIHNGCAIAGYIPEINGTLLYNPCSYTCQCDYTIELKNPK